MWLLRLLGVLVVVVVVGEAGVKVTVVVLDTNHPAGDYQGSVGLAQLALGLQFRWQTVGVPTEDALDALAATSGI